MTSRQKYTAVEDIPRIVDGLKDTFAAGKTRPLEYRKAMLRQLGYMIQDNEDRWVKALKDDLNRSPIEAYGGDLAVLKASIAETIAHLSSWAKPKGVKTVLMWVATRPQIHYDPKGTVLIIGAWNYPVSLTLDPLVGAIAAGNTAVVKPSENAPAVEALMYELMPKYLDSTAYRCVTGAVPETTALLDQPWDHIFYTGGGVVGKIIAQAAAKYLTPTTLELGGKSPCIVFDDANIATAGRRIAWGKSYNSGQTCIAPDYIIASSAIQDKLIASIQKAFKEFYPNGTLADNSGYAKVINSRQYDRLVNILETTTGEVVLGGKKDDGKLQIEPTFVKVKSLDDPLLQSEIFGPIIAVVTADSDKEIVDIINAVCPTPLALYYFTNNSKRTDTILKRTRSGSVVQNDTLVQFIIPGLPFGGTGQSGHGNYHGEHSFKTFSHERAVVNVPNFIEKFFDVRYPPYTDRKIWINKTFLVPKIRGRRQHPGHSTEHLKDGSGGVVRTLAKQFKGFKLLRLIVILAAIVIGWNSRA